MCGNLHKPVKASYTTSDTKGIRDLARFVLEGAGNVSDPRKEERHADLYL
jgi:hypothetical protein